LRSSSEFTSAINEDSNDCPPPLSYGNAAGITFESKMKPTSSDKVKVLKDKVRALQKEKRQPLYTS
jgi:hypothetical protein